jgi:ribosomal protein S18 acetylase RimI-like enzyme
MTIKAYNTINEEIINQIREVEASCKIYDGSKGDIYLDTSLNVYPEMNSLFLLYKDSSLVSVLFIFMPSTEVAEVSAFTLPEHRQKGYFKKLLKEAAKELIKYGPPELLLVCETQSKPGFEAVKNIEGELEFTEYFLRYKGSLNVSKNHQLLRIKLQEASLKDFEVIVELRQQIFNESYEDVKSIVQNTMQSENRIQYIATLEDDPVGVGAVSFDKDEVSINGLGISPQYQGKGYGRELLTLIIHELQKKGVQEITIDVNSSNENAFHLYKSCGFEVETAFDYYKVNIDKLIQ